MSEEVPFKSLKITLSDEAIAKLQKLRTTAALRSDSATIEECIRTFYEIAMDVYYEADRAAQSALSTNSKLKPIDIGTQAELLRKIFLRMTRFVPYSDAMKKLLEKYPEYRTDNNL